MIKSKKPFCIDVGIPKEVRNKLKIKSGNLFHNQVETNNSILTPYYFDPMTEYINQNDFNESIKEGLTIGYELFKKQYVEYPFIDHPLNSNSNYSLN